MFQYTSLARDKKWQPGPYPGVELLVLHKSEETGGVTVLRKLERLILAEHPYETPEFLVLQLTAGTERYLAWLQRETQPPQ